VTTMIQTITVMDWLYHTNSYEMFPYSLLYQRLKSLGIFEQPEPSIAVTMTRQFFMYITVSVTIKIVRKVATNELFL